MEVEGSSFFFAGAFFYFDVDVIAGEFTGQFGVLALAADGQRQLVGGGGDNSLGFLCIDLNG